MATVDRFERANVFHEYQWQREFGVCHEHACKTVGVTDAQLAKLVERARRDGDEIPESLS